MLSFNLIFLSALCLTILSGAAATWLVVVARGFSSSRKKVAEQLAQIALLGAAAIFALLGSLAE